MAARRLKTISQVFERNDQAVISSFLDGYRSDDPQSFNACIETLREFISFTRHKLKSSGHESPVLVELSDTNIARMVHLGGKEASQWLEGVMIRVMSTHDRISNTAFNQLVNFLREYARVYR